MPPSAQLTLPVSPRPTPTRRGTLLRLAFFGTVLGAVLTLVYAWVLARQDAGGEWSLLAAYHQVVVPSLALAAVAGVLLLERSPTTGMLAMLTAAVLTLGGGGYYLIPGAMLGCAWAAGQSPAARTLLGFLLLLPGTAAGYYGIMATLSFRLQQPLPGLPPALNPPLHLANALQPFEFLPAALLGAWLLVAPARKG